MTVNTGHKETEAILLSVLAGHPLEPRTASCHTHSQRPHARPEEGRNSHCESQRTRGLASTLRRPRLRTHRTMPGPPRTPRPVPVETNSASTSNSASPTSPRAPLPKLRGPSKPASGPGLLHAAGLAFLGGLLLNLMPCVFPVLFIKGLSLVQSGNEERHKLRTHGFVYAAGILVSFWVSGWRAAWIALGGCASGLGIPISIAGLSFADGRAAVLPRPFASRTI